MKEITYSLAVLPFFFFLTVGCKRSSSPTQPNQATPPNLSPLKRSPRPRAFILSEAEVIKRSKVVSKEAFRALSGKLRRALRSGGVKQAITTCKVQAPSVTTRIGQRYKVALSRVSHKPRNPKNKANSEERKIIQSYMTDLKAGKALQPVVRKQKSTQTYYSPILLAMPVCLKCHGEVGKQIKTKDYAVIRRIYPKDKATQFKLGEVRGLWKVQFKTE